MDFTKLNQPPPANAMRLAMEEPPEVVKNEDKGKALKVHMKARSKMTCNSPWFGPFVHDFSTMSMPPRIAIDDTHGQEIGFGRPYLTEYGIEIDATIIPNAENAEHPANRIVYNLSNGIPQQASIDFTGPFDIEYVMEKQDCEVNGTRLSGPLTMIRNWTLRACAICKEGMDVNTESALMNQKSVPPRSVKPAEFTISTNQEAVMADEDKKKKKDGECAEDENKKNPDGEEGNEPEGGNKGEDNPEDKKPEPDPDPEPEKKDKKENDAEELKKELDALKKENGELKAKLSAVPASGAKPVGMSAGKQNREALLAEYATLSASDKTLFWRKHKNELMAK